MKTILFPLVIAFALAAVSVALWNGLRGRAALHQDAEKVRSIVGMCAFYDQDFGVPPIFAQDATPAEGQLPLLFTTSTDVFNELIKNTEFSDVTIFQVASSWSKYSSETKNDELVASANGFSYVLGPYSECHGVPLVAHAMEGQGYYGARHPYLREKKAIVGYTGMRVRIHKLTGFEPGSLIRTSNRRDNAEFTRLQRGAVHSLHLLQRYGAVSDNDLGQYHTEFETSWRNGLLWFGPGLVNP